MTWFEDGLGAGTDASAHSLAVAPAPTPRPPWAWRATPVYANTTKPRMPESKTDEVYFFQSQWLVFHLQCHYSLTEQSRACRSCQGHPLTGGARPDGSASRWRLGRCLRCGRVVWCTCREICPIPLRFNFSNPELHFSNHF